MQHEKQNPLLTDTWTGFIGIFIQYNILDTHTNITVQSRLPSNFPASFSLVFGFQACNTIAQTKASQPILLEAEFKKRVLNSVSFTENKNHEANMQTIVKTLLFGIIGGDFVCCFKIFLRDKPPTVRSCISAHQPPAVSAGGAAVENISPGEISVSLF